MLQQPMDAGDAAVGRQLGAKAERGQGGGALLGHDEVGGAGRENLNSPIAFGRRPPDQGRALALAARVGFAASPPPARRWPG